MTSSSANKLGFNIRQTGAAGLLAIAWLTLPAILGFTLLASLGNVSSWLTGLGPVGPLIFACLFAATSGCGVLPTYAQAVLAGWAFGAGIGLVASLAGFVGGALLGWAIASAVSGDRIVHLIDRHPHGKIIRRSIVERGVLANRRTGRPASATPELTLCFDESGHGRCQSTAADLSRWHRCGHAASNSHRRTHVGGSSSAW